LSDNPDGSTAGPDVLLSLEEVSGGYAGHAVVSGVSLALRRGEIACIIGPNGAGKSTLVRCVTRDAQLLGGRVWLDGEDITRMPAERLVGRGLGWVPQLQDVFPALTVRENLEMGGYTLRASAVQTRVAEVMELFPMLRTLTTRPASRLSGGERKILALGRAVMTRPAVMLLDEPTANLSPEMARVVLQDYVRALAGAGVAVLLIEQRAVEAVGVADWVHVMVGGRLRVSEPASAVTGWEDIGRLFLGSEGIA
jgi:branched-chain amino acid transport system ATP-binding protein